MAQPFDDKNLRLTGEPVRLADDIGRSQVPQSPAGFWASDAGVLAYRTDSARRRIVWVSREGKEIQEVAREDAYWDLRLSPDGKRSLVGRSEGFSAKADLWMIDFGRSGTVKVTLGGTEVMFQRALAWSADGKWIAHTSTRSGVPQVYRQNLGTGQEEQITDDAEGSMAADWSRDGRYLLISKGINPAARSTWAIALDETGEARKPFLVAKARTGYASSPAFSPDGKWVAYDSNESGRVEVYVQPFAPNTPGKSGRWQISSGGYQPRWRADGKELFYNQIPGVVASAVVRSSGAEFESDPPREIVRLPLPAAFEVSPDGQRFLTYAPPLAKDGMSPIDVILNWQAKLK